MNYYIIVYEESGVTKFKSSGQLPDQMISNIMRFTRNEIRPLWYWHVLSYNHANLIERLLHDIQAFYGDPGIYALREFGIEFLPDTYELLKEHYASTEQELIFERLRRYK